MKWFLSSLLLSVFTGLSSADLVGHGPRAIYPITERYVALVDSSIDAVLIVDNNAGGAVVGHYVLHDESVNDNPDRWVNPISITSCADCKHIFITNPFMFFKIALDKPLADMARSLDFSGFTQKSQISPVWYDGWNPKYQNDGNIRMVSAAADGSSGYMTHKSGGVFSFNPLSPSKEDPSAKHAIKIGEAGIEENDINGIHHTSSLKNIILTSSKYVHIVKTRDSDGNNPLDYDKVTAYKLPLDYHCDYLYGGTDMTFMDMVIIDDYAFVLGHPTPEKGQHNGVAIYRLTWDDDDEQWHNCVQIAGSGLKDAEWVDGSGKEARFSATVHDIDVLPTADSKSHIIVMPDTGNRAVRFIDVSYPVEAGDETDKVRVYSAPYNEHLYEIMYSSEASNAGMTPELAMASDGKSYYHGGMENLYTMNFNAAQDECARVGIGRVCTLPEIRARFARGQYPTPDGDDESWTTVWMNEDCSSCHLADPGACESSDWGDEYKMIAIFRPVTGLEAQCVHNERPVDTYSMCCGVGGPAVLDGTYLTPKQQQQQQAKKAAGISFGVLIPFMLIGVAIYGVYMRKRAKPAWWPKFLRQDRREETGHAPHREVDLRGRDYI
uniref:Uncharacterized protein n=1 Tax=Skeletonema marinoi TaxID=267567 RepID=A0A7S2LEE1_9STRA